MTNTHFTLPPIVTTLALTVLVLLVVYLSFATQEQGSAYMFPRLLAVMLLVTLVVDIVSDYRHQTIAVIQIERDQLVRFAPGALLIFGYVGFAEAVGFYTISWLFVILLTCYYHCISDDVWKGRVPLAKWLGFDIMYATLFTLVIYLLFAIVLRVQAPSGWFL